MVRGRLHDLRADVRADGGAAVPPTAVPTGVDGVPRRCLRRADALAHHLAPADSAAPSPLPSPLPSVPPTPQPSPEPTLARRTAVHRAHGRAVVTPAPKPTPRPTIPTPQPTREPTFAPTGCRPVPTAHPDDAAVARAVRAADARASRTPTSPPTGSTPRRPCRACSTSSPPLPSFSCNADEVALSRRYFPSGAAWGDPDETKQSTEQSEVLDLSDDGAAACEFVVSGFEDIAGVYVASPQSNGDIWYSLASDPDRTVRPTVDPSGNGYDFCHPTVCACSAYGAGDRCGYKGDLTPGCIYRWGNTAADIEERRSTRRAIG